jgi:hypothetical protein
MPRGLCQQVIDAWTGFWSDVVSGAMRPADTAVAARWAKNFDRYLRLIAQADREPMILGSQGQMRPNPLYRLAMLLEASIRADEAQMGIGPLNRLRLGAQFSEAAKTLAEINTEAANDGADDPRANLIALADRRTTTPVEPGTD